MRHYFLERIADVEESAWNRLLGNNYPFAQHQYLNALEASGCVGGDSGWLPCHLILEDSSGLVAALPLYEKTHSYGEYVFDWAWADAFHRYGHSYYPKLVSSIPFTPVAGPRFLTRENTDPSACFSLACEALINLCRERGYSGWHLLFPDDQLRDAAMSQDNLLYREAVQFHWMNRDSASGEPYTDFEHFLQGFRSSKRKQIRRERRKVTEQGLTLERRTGSDIRDLDWEAFYACYQTTYLKRSGHTGYLNLDFFEEIAHTLSEQCMLVTASLDGDPVASSLFFFDDHRLYGRYWGALYHFDSLHFEACYYQGIEFAIERGLQRFDPGTQGEHKLVRGFEPIKTCSCHWIENPEFSIAIENFLERERQHTDYYQEAATGHLPFHRVD